MKKIIIILLLLFPICVSALELPETYSKNVLVYDLTDDIILHSLNADEKRNVASLTKIVTTITAIENINDLDQKVVVTAEMLKGIPWDASIAGLKVGDELTIRDVLYASILPSGADATHVLAFTASGSVNGFVESMNELAKRIGATNTNFVNVTGYDIANHYSTANDMLKILKYALNNKTFKEIYCTKEHTMSNGKVVKATVVKYNELLHLDISRIKGSKTGFTDEAGTCISVLTESNGHEFIIITLNAPPITSEAYNLKDALKLIDFLDNNYINEKLLSINQEIGKIEVKFSNIDEYIIKGSTDITKYLPIDYDKSKVKVEYEGKNSISFLNKIGNRIGKINVYYDNKLYASDDVILNVELSLDYMKILKEYYYFLIGIVVLIVLIHILRKKTKHKKS